MLSPVQLLVTLWTVGSSIHGISQARILEWVAIFSSRGSSQSRDLTQILWAPEYLLPLNDWYHHQFNSAYLKYRYFIIGLIPGWGRSPGEGKGYPLQYSCLENSLDWESWQATIYCCSVTQLCPTLCDPKDCSTSSFPVLHYLLRLAQSHVHWVSDAIQPSHPLSSPSRPAFNLSQHHGLF